MKFKTCIRIFVLVLLGFGYVTRANFRDIMVKKIDERNGVEILAVLDTDELVSYPLKRLYYPNGSRYEATKKDNLSKTFLILDMCGKSSGCSYSLIQGLRSAELWNITLIVSAGSDGRTLLTVANRTLTQQCRYELDDDDDVTGLSPILPYWGLELIEPGIVCARCWDYSTIASRQTCLELTADDFALQVTLLMEMIEEPPGFEMDLALGPDVQRLGVSLNSTQWNGMYIYRPGAPVVTLKQKEQGSLYGEPTFFCALDDGAFLPCSETVYSREAIGCETHRLSAYAKQSLLGLQSSIATRSYKVCGSNILVSEISSANRMGAVAHLSPKQDVGLIFFFLDQAPTIADKDKVCINELIQSAAGSKLPLQLTSGPYKDVREEECSLSHPCYAAPEEYRVLSSFWIRSNKSAALCVTSVRYDDTPGLDLLIAASDPISNVYAPYYWLCVAGVAGCYIFLVMQLLFPICQKPKRDAVKKGFERNKERLTMLHGACDGELCKETGRKQKQFLFPAAVLGVKAQRSGGYCKQCLRSKLLFGEWLNEGTVALLRNQTSGHLQRQHSSRALLRQIESVDHISLTVEGPFDDEEPPDAAPPSLPMLSHALTRSDSLTSKLLSSVTAGTYRKPAPNNRVREMSGDQPTDRRRHFLREKKKRSIRAKRPRATRNLGSQMEPGTYFERRFRALPDIPSTHGKKSAIPELAKPENPDTVDSFAAALASGTFSPSHLPTSGDAQMENGPVEAGYSKKTHKKAANTGLAALSSGTFSTPRVDEHILARESRSRRPSGLSIEAAVDSGTFMLGHSPLSEPPQLYREEDNSSPVTPGTFRRQR